MYDDDRGNKNHMGQHVGTLTKALAGAPDGHEGVWR